MVPLYEIAGKGAADSGSFKEAVFTAIQIYKNRFDYDELTSNPLKKSKQIDVNKKIFISNVA